MEHAMTDNEKNALNYLKNELNRLNDRIKDLEDESNSDVFGTFTKMSDVRRASLEMGYACRKFRKMMV